MGVLVCQHAWDIIKDMKILVINNDLMERTVIQQVLHHNKHEIVLASDSSTAMNMLQHGDIRFVIADRATSDIDEKEFIKRIRDAKPPYYIYILLITPRVQDGDLINIRGGADDYLNKPVAPIELKSRVQMGERILGLGDNLLQAQADLDNLAMFDPLTNMLNLKAFITLARGELERSRRNQAPFSLIAVTIHNFDEINKNHGPEIARDVLVMLSQAIREKNRPYDNVGQIEQTKFLIPLPFVIGQDAEKIAQRISKGIINTNFALLDGTVLDVRTGIGVVSATRVATSTEIESMIEKARDVLASSAKAGGNQIPTIFI